MQILFTRNNSILSRLIRFLTGEGVSHCAVRSGPLVIHSNLYGPHIESYEHFNKKSTVVYSVDVEFSEERLYQLLGRYESSTYDFAGLIYLGIRCMFPFLPKANLWQHTGMYLCTEWVQEILGTEIDSSITPYKLYRSLKEN